MVLNQIKFVSCYFNQNDNLYAHVFTTARVDNHTCGMIIKTVEEMWTHGIKKVKKDKHVITFKNSLMFDSRLIEDYGKLQKFKGVVRLSSNLPVWRLIPHNLPQVVPKRVINKIKKELESVNIIEPFKVHPDNLSEAFDDTTSVCSLHTEDFELETEIKITELRKSKLDGLMESTCPIIKDVKPLIDEEMLRNIEMLKSINFLKDGGFYIQDDKALLIKPFAYAIGDFIKNRSGTFRDRFGLHFKISRIHDENWSYHY